MTGFGPPPVTALPDESVADYWKKRQRQQLNDSYKGLTLCKMPEDLRVYEHLIWDSKPRAIVELGSYAGGSAVWFADRLASLLGGGLVVSVDMRWVPVSDHRISFVQGDLRSSTTIRKVHSLVAGIDRIMIIDDSAHTHEVTFASLTAYGELVRAGGWFVVEDGIVDEPVSIWNDHGVQPAIKDFLATTEGARFKQHNLDIYGITSNHNGWLEAVR